MVVPDLPAATLQLDNAAGGSGLDSRTGAKVAIVTMLCLLLGPSSLLVASFGVLAGPFSDTYGWTRGQVAGGISFLAVAIMIVSLLQGALVDRFGSRRVVLISIPLFAISMLAFIWIPPVLPVFYLVWFLLPFASFGLWPAAYLKVVGGWFDKHLGLATGFANAGIGLGTIVIPPLLAWLIVRGGLSLAVAGIAGLAALAFPLAFLGLRENSRIASRPKPADAVSYPMIIQIRAYQRIALGFLLLGTTGTGLLGNLVPILIGKGLPMQAALSGLAGYGMLNLFGRLATGAMLDRFQTSRVMAALVATTIVALLLLVFADSLALSMAAGITLGLLAGGEFDVLAFMLRRNFPLQTFGKMYGLGFSAFQLGATIGAAALAISVGVLGSYDLGLLFLAASATVGGLLLSRVGGGRTGIPADAKHQKLASETAA